MIFRQVSTDPDHDEQADDALFYRDTLQELIQIGTDLARLLHQHAIAQAQAAVRDLAPCAPPTEHAAAFDRIARAVRRTIALARSLSEPLARALARTRAAARTPTPPGAGQDAAGHPAAIPGRETADAEVSSADLRDRPEAQDRDAPDCDAPDRDAPDREGDDRDEDDTNRPPAEIIKEICRDLGLDTPPGADAWTRRTPAGAAQPCAQAAAPSSAAASCAPKPGAMPQSLGPQDIMHSAAKPCPSPEPGNGEPGAPDQPAAAARAQPVPAQPRATLPDPTEAAACVLQHPAQIQERWRPPPKG